MKIKFYIYRMKISNKVTNLIYGMFDAMIEGVDKYATKSSTWLIFTEEKRWVIEFTNEKTLWFNYNLFQSELNLLSMDCVESKDIIKEWFESRFLGIDAVEETLSTAGKPLKVEDTIQNGVKHTRADRKTVVWRVEDTIQNGVRHTCSYGKGLLKQVEDTIQNGVKYTMDSKWTDLEQITDTIQNGVKEVEKGSWFNVLCTEDAIQNGVKDTIGTLRRTKLGVDDIIKNGVKNTNFHNINSNGRVDETIQNGVKETQTRMWPPVGAVDETIQNGVKETRFQKSSNLYRIEDTRTLWGKSGDEGVVEYIIQEGVKDTTTTRWARKDAVENTIQNGVKHTEDGDWLDQDERIDDIIQNGVKETREISNISLMSEIFKVNAKQAIRDGVKELKVWKSNRCEEHGYFEFVDGIPTYTPMTQVKDVLENGVKEIQPLPARDGNRDWGLYYQRQGNLTKPHTEYVKEVIEDSYNHMGRVEGVIRNTDKDGI
jgi:predicted transcriptional regulator